jgi:hypothetical protein
MTRRVRSVRFAAIVSLAAALVAGCTLVDQGGQPVEREAVGLVTAVEGSGPADVRQFTLRTDEGQILSFSILPGRLSATAFPAAHLREHLASVQKVRVRYVVESGTFIPIDLADAG